MKRGTWPDYIAIGKWLQQFVKDAGYEPLTFEMEQTMANEIVDAALGSKVLLVESYPNPGDGTALSEEEHDEAHEAWYQIQEAERLGYLVQVWPLKEEK